MHDPIELVRAEAIHTAVIRSRVRAEELPRFVPAACGEAWAFIRSAGLPRPGRHVALYLDAGWVEVGAEVSEPFVGNDRVHFSQLPASRVVTTAHFGPYSGLAAAHAALRAWCDGQGHRSTGISWELYGHWEESWNTDPSKIRTDVRPERSEDIAAISRVTEEAFRGHPHSSHTEQFIVAELRRCGASSLSLVAEWDSAVVGHIAFSPVEISDGSPGWYGLGPVSVAPDFQRRGIGQALVSAGLAALRSSGAEGCVVLGEPEFYVRFGFRNHPDCVLEGVPAEYFQVLSFGGRLASGTVSYHPAFSAGS